MRFIDDRGRLFGRFNIVDAAIGAFVLMLIPIAYGTFLLFRSPAPHITSVTRAPITKEERRIAGGSRLSAKLKVRGSGFRPMLRASIDDTPALGFVFENPNSADVLVGEAAPGTHDLVIYDGVQEVARAARAVTIQAVAPARVRVVGTLFDLDEGTARALHAGPTTPLGATFQGEIVQLGPVLPGRHRLTTGQGSADVVVAGRSERPVVMVLQCDLDPNDEDCAVGGTTLAATPSPVVRLVGPGSIGLSLAIGELLPVDSPHPAVARIRFSGAGEMLDLIRVGDRDTCLDERAATVTAVERRRSDNGVTLDATVKLGADESRDGWRYRGRIASPGAAFTLTTNRYVASGSVIALTVDPREPERR